METGIGRKTEAAPPPRTAPPPLPASVAQPLSYRGPDGRRPHSNRVTVTIVVLVLLVIAAITVYLVYRGLHAATVSTGRAALAGKALPVVAVQARQGDMPVYIDGLLGLVTPLKTVSIHPRVEGEIQKIYFKEGQLVAKDAPLFDIDPRPYQATLQQALAQQAKDSATLEGAKSDLRRYQNALTANPGSVTQQQIDDQQALVDQDAAAVQADAANVDADQLNVDYCQIKSPIDGLIGLQMINEGNLVDAGNTTTLAVITQIQPITVIFHLAEGDLSRVLQKMPTSTTRPLNPLVVDAFNSDETAQLTTGKLFAIDSQVDVASGTVAMKAWFKNANSELFPNEFVDIRLTLDTLHGVVIVPSAAVQQGPDSMFVWVVGKDDKVQVRNVVTGAAEGERTQIVSGLQPGETVVTQGVDKLIVGTAVVPMSPQDAGMAGPSTRSSTRKSGGGPRTRRSTDQ